MADQLLAGRRASRLGFFALVAVATTALIPISAARSSKAAADVSNVKHIGMGIIMYSADYDDTAPPGRTWMTTIYPYTQNNEILHCRPFGKYGDQYGHAMHRLATTLDLARLARPDTRVLVLDSTNLKKHAVSDLAEMPREGRDNGSNSVAYADGHVQAIRTDYPTPFVLEPTFDLLCAAGVTLGGIFLGALAVSARRKMLMRLDAQDTGAQTPSE